MPQHIKHDISDPVTQFQQDLQGLWHNKNNGCIWRKKLSRRETGSNDNKEDKVLVEEVEDVEVATVMDEYGDCSEYQLPKHHNCPCHLLNLVSTFMFIAKIVRCIIFALFGMNGNCYLHSY